MRACPANDTDKRRIKRQKRSQHNERADEQQSGENEDDESDEEQEEEEEEERTDDDDDNDEEEDEEIPCNQVPPRPQQSVKACPYRIDLGPTEGREYDEELVGIWPPPPRPQKYATHCILYDYAPSRSSSCR